MIVLENVDGCLEATMLTDATAPTIIEHAAVTDRGLTGTVYVSSRPVKVTLDFAPAGATGSIVGARIASSARRRRWVLRPASGVPSRSSTTEPKVRSRITGAPDR
jgi:hypothetical protein